mmetsp:Transcript_8971/g.26810  ORF Transcript_8971/g.26810 Transcript_8971/m.26810 type:complete len:214 (+) Transcript_8971:545-1186(+)
MTMAWAAPPEAPAANPMSAGGTRLVTAGVDSRTRWTDSLAARRMAPESEPSISRADTPEYMPHGPRSVRRRRRTGIAPAAGLASNSALDLPSNFLDGFLALIFSRTTLDFQTSRGRPPQRSHTQRSADPRARLRRTGPEGRGADADDKVFADKNKAATTHINCCFALEWMHLLRNLCPVIIIFLHGMVRCLLFSLISSVAIVSSCQTAKSKEP